MNGLNSIGGITPNNCRIIDSTPVDMVSNRNALVHSRPGTPKQLGKEMNNPSAFTIDLNEKAHEGEEQKIGKDMKLCVDEKIGEDIELDMKLQTGKVSSPQQDFLHQKNGDNIEIPTKQKTIESQTAIISTVLEEMKDSEYGIDLNKRPEQKARKRKHRPKVIREGIAKQVTQKKATNKEKSLPKKSQKRGPKSSVRHLADDTSHLREPPALTRKIRQRSCKQYLNFDVESSEEDKCLNKGPHKMDKPMSTSSHLDSVCQTTQTEDFTDFSPANQSKGTTSTSTSSHMWDSECQTSQTLSSCGSKSAWDALGISSCVKKIILEDYLRLQGSPNTPPITEVEASASVNGSDAIHNSMSQYAYPHIEEAAESIQGRKRKERNTEGDYDVHSISFPKIYKKKRTSSCKRFMLHTIDVTYCEVGNDITKYPIAGEIAEEKHGTQEFVDPQTEVPINRKNLIDDVFNLWIERRIKKKRTCRIRRLPTRIATEENDKQCRKATIVFRGPQPCVEALNAEENAKMRTKKRTNTRRKSHNPNSKNMKLLPMQLETNNGSSCFQTASVMSFPSQALSVYKYLVEDLIREFTLLSVNGISKTEMAGALVLYGGDKTLVPYVEQFAKKRRSRAKVELDAETNRVWRLLMWKEGTDGTNEIDVEKEEWWQEQRRVFQGRTESFIAKMHLLQGTHRKHDLCISFHLMVVVCIFSRSFIRQLKMKRNQFIYSAPRKELNTSAIQLCTIYVKRSIFFLFC